MDMESHTKSTRSCNKPLLFFFIAIFAAVAPLVVLNYNRISSQLERPIPMHFSSNINTIVINNVIGSTVRDGKEPKGSKNDSSLSDDMPSIRGTAITAQEIRQNLEDCKSYSIANDKSCARVHENSKLYWRSIKTEGFSHKDDFSRMSMATRCCAFNQTELIAPSPSDDLFPWEQDYLSQGGLTNIQNTSWATKSSVEFVDKAANKVFYVGAEIRFLLRIRNGRGEAREKGGDNIRLWLVNKELKASVTANMLDFGNGTYQATVKLPWSGKAVVRATVAHTRELFRSTLYVQRLFTTSHWLIGLFKNSKASEFTPCSPVSYLPGFPLPSEICNLTEYNGGNPWYCGKPVKKALSCADMAGVERILYPSVQPITPADRELVKLTESKRPFLIPTEIELKVEKEPKSNLTTLAIPPLACQQRDLTTTFEEPMSTGYFYQAKWWPFACRLPKVDTQFSHECLRNTTVILIGDSNSRSQIYDLYKLTQCTEKIKRTKVKWHAPLRCDVDKLGISIQFYPQSNPFYGSLGETMTSKMLTSAITKLDSIPATGRYIIHLHYFLHVMPFHMSMTRTRLILARPAMARLVARNPTAYIVIQSPHSAYDRLPRNKHKMTIFLFDMTKSILSGLGKNVMFVNTLDPTIANENDDGHPSISGEFMNLYLGHLCGRQ